MVRQVILASLLGFVSISVANQFPSQKLLQVSDLESYIIAHDLSEFSYYENEMQAKPMDGSALGSYASYMKSFIEGINGEQSEFYYTKTFRKGCPDYSNYFVIDNRGVHGYKSISLDFKNSPGKVSLFYGPKGGRFDLTSSVPLGKKSYDFGLMYNRYIQNHVTYSDSVKLQFVGIRDGKTIHLAGKCDIDGKKKCFKLTLPANTSNVITDSMTSLRAFLVEALGSDFAQHYDRVISQVDVNAEVNVGKK